MKTRWILPAMICLALVALAGEPVVGIYTIHFTDPQTTAELVQQMILTGDDGNSVRIAGNRLIVLAQAAQHAEIQALLDDLDQPPRNVRIEVHIDRQETRSDREAGIRPRGPVVIGPDGVQISLEGRLQDRMDRTSERTMQMLTVMDGGRAQLRVGESVPWISWLTEYSFRRGYIQTTRIEWIEVGSFLSVEPEILAGGLIRIRVVPTLSGRDGEGLRQTIRFTEAATEVVVRDGSTISIGGFSKDDEFDSRFLVGRSGGQDTVLTGITLTPVILTP